jgi:hypothetical protein
LAAGLGWRIFPCHERRFQHARRKGCALRLQSLRHLGMIDGEEEERVAGATVLKVMLGPAVCQHQQGMQQDFRPI